MTRLTSLLMLLLAPAACGRTADAPATAAGGTIVISMAADVDALVPPLISQTTGRQVAEQIFDRLAQIGDNLSTIDDIGFTPALAESWSWASDSQSIAFRLRADARWHDGKRVTAEDVRFSYSLYADSLVASPVASSLATIDSVTVADSLTAVIWYGRRTPQQFFESTYFLFVLPKHLLDTVPRQRLRESEFARTPVGSGRFRFARRVPGVSIEVVADSVNYRGRPNPDRLVWVVATDFNTAVTRFLSGEADVFEHMRREHLDELRTRRELRAWTYPSLEYGFVQFNLRDSGRRDRPHSLFADRELRRALSMAVDRQALVRNVFDTLAVVARGPMTRALAFADTTIPQLPYDTARAVRLLDSLGWRRGTDGVRARGGRQLRFTLLVPSSSRNRVRMAVLLQEQMRSIGVRTEIEQLEYGAFVERSRRRRFDAVFGAWRIDVGPTGIRQTWGTAGSRSPNGLNYGSYENPEFDAHVDSALSARAVPTGRAHFRRALELIVQDAPAIWLYEPHGVLGFHRRLRPARVRPDAWWAGLADWVVSPEERLSRDSVVAGTPIP